MKKTVKIISVIAILALALVILAGCANNDTKVELSRGKIENNVYRSDFADITFNLPEGWSFSSDEEIAQLMDVGVEMLNEDQQKFAELAEENGVYDMVANDESTGASLMVMFEKTLLNVNEEYYINNLKEGLEEVDSIDYEIGETTKQNIAGKEFYVLNTTVPDYNMVQNYYIQKKGDYFVDILVTYIEGTEDINSLLSNFQ